MFERATRKTSFLQAAALPSLPFQCCASVFGSVFVIISWTLSPTPSSLCPAVPLLCLCLPLPPPQFPSPFPSLPPLPPPRRRPLSPTPTVLAHVLPPPLLFLSGSFVCFPSSTSSSLYSRLYKVFDDNVSPVLLCMTVPHVHGCDGLL